MEREKFLKCPFCGAPQMPPMEINTPFGGSVDGGRCECGAVYVYDRTGRKMGEAYQDAIALAFDWEYDAAVAAGEGEFEEGASRYSARARAFLSGEGDFRDRMPKFFFIKRKKA